MCVFYLMRYSTFLILGSQLTVGLKYIEYWYSLPCFWTLDSLEGLRLDCHPPAVSVGRCQHDWDFENTSSITSLHCTQNSSHHFSISHTCTAALYIFDTVPGAESGRLDNKQTFYFHMLYPGISLLYNYWFFTECVLYRRLMSARDTVMLATHTQQFFRVISDIVEVGDLNSAHYSFTFRGNVWLLGNRWQIKSYQQILLTKLQTAFYEFNYRKYQLNYLYLVDIQYSMQFISPVHIRYWTFAHCDKKMEHEEKSVMDSVRSPLFSIVTEDKK